MFMTKFLATLTLSIVCIYFLADAIYWLAARDSFLEDLTLVLSDEDFMLPLFLVLLLLTFISFIWKW
jgi:hypothetical protein